MVVSKLAAPHLPLEQVTGLGINEGVRLVQMRDCRQPRSEVQPSSIASASANWGHPYSVRIRVSKSRSINGIYTSISSV